MDLFWILHYLCLALSPKGFLETQQLNKTLYSMYPIYFWNLVVEYLDIFYILTLKNYILTHILNDDLKVL